MKYKPNPDSRLEAYMWTGDLEDVPLKWRERARFEVGDDDTLLVPTPHGYAECKLGWHVGEDDGGGFYVLSRAIMLARWIPEDAS